MAVTRRAGRLTFVLAMMTALGCSSQDQRLVELSERSSERQQEQNKVIARQSEAVTRESQQVAQAARELVAKDAEARKELVQAQRVLQAEIQAERSSLDRQREELQQERRDIARQRGRDPIIAETIKSVGLLLVCLVPLIVAAYALSRMERGRSDGDELSELLVRELTSDRPLLLPPACVPALEDRRESPSDESSDPSGEDLAREDEPEPSDCPF